MATARETKADREKATVSEVTVGNPQGIADPNATQDLVAVIPAGSVAKLNPNPVNAGSAAAAIAGPITDEDSKFNPENADRAVVRALRQGFDGAVRREEGEEFTMVIYRGIEPPSWVEIVKKLGKVKKASSDDE